MWHLSNIPKIAYFFWGTESLPWIRYLTLETFRKYHPDWKIYLYKLPVLQKNTDDYNNKNCWDKISSLDIEIKDIDIEKHLGVDFKCKFITIYADIFRYVVLKETGGFYADMDHLFFKSLEDIPDNNEQNKDKSVFLLKPPFHHFIFGIPDALWYKIVLDKQLQTLPDSIDNFLNTTASTEQVEIVPDYKICVLPFETTEENFTANGPINNSAVALNWHGSGVDRKYNNITEQNYKDSDHPLAACIRYCLDGDIGKTNEIGSFKWIDRYD